MGSAYRNYTKELKEEICRLVTKDNIPVKTVGDKFGIRVQEIYRWIRQYETYSDEAFVGSGKLRSHDAELRKLKRENEDLRLENEFLKKAAAYLAKEKAKQSK